MKYCDVNDLGGDKYAEDIYANWKNDDYDYDIFCPDLEKFNYSLYNHKGEKRLTSIAFRIDECDSQTRSDCKPHEEIIEFTKDLTVQFWIVEA